MWLPILRAELLTLIDTRKNLLPDNLQVVWQAIRITPEKWQEMEYGEEGNGFWVIAIFGKRIIWYNDIEEGFNIFPFEKYGLIGEYGAEQYEFHHIIWQLEESVRLEMSRQ